MHELQHRLSKGLGPDDSAVVLRWWAGLSATTREELEVLWDRRGDSCSQSFGPGEDGNVAWHALPIVRGQFVRPGEVAEDEEWRADHFEYLLDHPEIWVPEDPAQFRRMFHIGCTAHARSREVLAAGHIPADFGCPIDSAECPLKELLRIAPGHAFRLHGQPKPSETA